MCGLIGVELTITILCRNHSVQVLASPTENMGTLLNAVHSVHIGGELKLSNAIQVAQLALKHRRTKTGAFTYHSLTNAGIDPPHFTDCRL